MRIRCRAISYDNLVLESDEVEIEQYKFLEHLHPTQRHEVINCSSETVITRSAIPECLSYLRPLPTRPVVESFMKEIDACKGPLFTLTTQNLDGMEGDDALLSYDDHRLQFTKHLELTAEEIRRKSEDYLVCFLQHSDTISLPDCCRLRHVYDERECSTSTARYAFFRFSCNLLNHIHHSTRLSHERKLWENKCGMGDEVPLSKKMSKILWKITKYVKELTDGQEVFQSMEEDSNEHVFDTNFLEGAHKHNELEFICRESMAIVLKNQLNSCLFFDENRTEDYYTQVKNESDHFLRTDPFLPITQTNFTGGKRNQDNVTRSRFHLSANRGLGVNGILSYQRVLPTHKLAVDSQIRMTHADAESSMRSFLSEHIAILRNHENNSSISDQCHNFTFDPPLSSIPSDPDIPLFGHSRATIPALLSIKGTLQPFRTKFLHDKVKVHQVKPRHDVISEGKTRKARLWEKTFSGPGFTNGLNLRSISIIADRMSLNNSLFLPHIREKIPSPVVIERPTPKLSHTVGNLLPHRLRMSKTKDFSSLLDIESVNEALQGNNMKRLLKAVSTDIKRKPTDFEYLILSNDAFFSLSIEATCELTHLAKKVENVSKYEDSEGGPHVFQHSLDKGSDIIPTINKYATDTISLCDINATNMDRQIGVFNSRDSTRISSLHNADMKKRTQGPENDKHNRKEQKRLKMEKKLAKKARKSRKRRKQKNCDDVDLSRSNEVDLITVPSLHIGSTPMVITRKIQTMTEEVCFSSHMPMSKRQRFCNNDNGMSRTSYYKHSSLTPVVAFDDSRGDSGRCSATRQICDNGVYEKVPSPTQKYLANGRLSESTSKGAASYDKKSNSLAEANGTQKDECESTDVPSVTVDCALTTDDVSHVEMIPNDRDNSSQDLGERRQVQQNIDVNLLMKTKEVYNSTSQSDDAKPNIEDNHNAREHLTEMNEPGDRVIQILCGEDFFSHSSQAAAELSSGRWAMNSIKERRTYASNIKFDLRDSRIVDDCGVDVELPGRVGIKVLWIENQLLHGAFDSKEQCKNLVQLASTGRYVSIYVIVVLSIGYGSNYNANDLCLLQNALVKQRGCVCQKISFQYAAPTLLGATIAQLIVSHPLAPPGILESLVEDHIIEKVSFLLGLMPTLTAYEALSFINGQKDGSFGRLVLRAIDNNSFDDCSLRPASVFQLRQCLLANVGIYASS